MTVEDCHNYLIVGNVILKNCDALRYFCVTRVLGAEYEKQAEEELTDRSELTDYDEEMCGGDADANYITYGGG